MISPRVSPPGQVDELKSPSARLVMGQPFGGGTGMFSLVNKMTAALDF